MPWEPAREPSTAWTLGELGEEGAQLEDSRVLGAVRSGNRAEKHRTAATRAVRWTLGRKPPREHNEVRT